MDMQPDSPAYGREIELFERKGEGPGIRFSAFFVDMIIVGLVSALIIGLVAVLLQTMQGDRALEDIAFALSYVIIYP